MKINQFNKSLQITKAEEDSTTASEKAKNTQPGIHDSFETGTPTPPENQSGGSAPAPQMKAEPAAEKILNQQLIKARLTEPGIKSPGSNSEKEPAVKKDPGIPPGEAETTLRTDVFGGNARSNREKMAAGMSDFLAGFGSINILLVGSIYRLRKVNGNTKGYRTPGYPVVPFIYVFVMLLFLLSAIYFNPSETLIGLAIMTTAVPVFLWISKKGIAKET